MTETAVVVVTAIFTPIPEHRLEVIEALGPAIDAVHQEPGCLLYAIHDSPDGTIVMIEKWETEDLLDVHGQGEAVAELGRALDGLLAAPTAVTRLVPLPRGDAAKGAL